MGTEKRVCLACGRPLTGRKKKWCGRPDCGGWEAVHPPIVLQCECGQVYQTYKGSGRTKCPSCYAKENKPSLEERICVECGSTFTRPENNDFLWCNGYCYDRYFKKHPQPDYFASERERVEAGLCAVCSNPLVDEFGCCSAGCYAILRARIKFRESLQKTRILASQGKDYEKVKGYEMLTQWFRFIEEHLWRPYGYIVTEEYSQEYQEVARKESRRMAIRMKLGLAEDAPIPDKLLPLTTELPLKEWLEEMHIRFESQKYIEIGSTYTYVDFFIPFPNSHRGICLYCDGDYWHGSDFPDVIEKDRMQNEELQKLGHIVIRVKESEIVNGMRPMEILDLLRE